MVIEVFTLGDFDIKVDKNSVLNKSIRANKNLELLKYFITFRNKKLVPESIVEDIWSEDECINPHNALRTQIFRLRKNIKKMGLMKDSLQKEGFGLVFENGFYILEAGKNCIFDIELFEKQLKEADAIKDVDINLGIQEYRETIDLYRGKYLAENPYSEWSYTIRNRYHRLYIQTVLKLMELLKSEKHYSDIIEIYEKAVVNAPFEESIHIFYLEALIELKQFKNALSHYNYFTGKIYREFSVSPSPVLQKIYRKITTEREGKRVSDVLFLGQDLSEDDDMEGALYCESDYFRTIYNLERRKSLRSGNTDFLGLISIIKNLPDITKPQGEQAIENLKTVLINSLRKGDVFCKWNQSQMLVLLTDVIEANLQLIEKRIQKRFRDLEPPTKFTIKIDFQPVTAINPFL